MARSDEKSLKLYLAETASWETDKVLELAKSRQWAWRMATATTVIAILSTTAVVALTPLKTSEPFVIRVDNSTGVVDVVKSLKQGETNHEESLNKYFLQLYVRNREGFNKETAADTYYSVGILSSTSEQQKFQEFFQPKNPRSPLNVYGQYAKVRVSIKGVSFVKPTVALVRYAKEIERSGDRPEISHWASTITFKSLARPCRRKTEPSIHSDFK
ncbi:virB8 family protein [Acidovorax facilis]|jgi:type IV secretion system protein VirB8|uniref:virB8 family protein n=1 Tax=Acidovorax facilis TaxID=12917 RepID=UPI003D648818